MKCSNCGAELAENATSCDSCGVSAAIESAVEQPVAAETAVETTEAPKQEKGPSKIKLAMAALGAKMKALAEKAQPIVDKCKPFVQKNKLYVAGAACVLILLITVLVIVGACNNGNGFTPVEHTIDAFVADGEIMIQYDNKKVVRTGIEATRIDETQTSIDGSVLAFLTNDGQLVVVKKTKATVVAEDVTSFVMSVNGKGIGFAAENDEGDFSLKLLKVGKKKAKTVANEFDNSTFALSPDGKSMAYYRYDNDNDESVLMYFNGSKSKKVTSSDVSLIGLSNKGKQIYVVGSDDEGQNILFSYNTRGNKKKIGVCTNLSFAFNEDHTQILFFDGSFGLTNIDLRTYISTKGKAAVRISSGMATLLLPRSSAAISSNNKAVTYPTDNLYNKVYRSLKDGQSSLWVFKKNVDNSKKLASNVSETLLDESAKYVYYTNKDNDLKVLKVSHGDRAADKAKLIAEDVDNFVVTSDRKKVYFLSEDALYSCNGKNGKGKKNVATDNLGAELVLNQRDVCYYTVDGDVYACSNGKRGKRVVTDAEYMYATHNGIVYVETEDAIFATKGAKKPSRIFTEG